MARPPCDVSLRDKGESADLEMTNVLTRILNWGRDRERQKSKHRGQSSPTKTDSLQPQMALNVEEGMQGPPETGKGKETDSAQEPGPPLIVAQWDPF